MKLNWKTKEESAKAILGKLSVNVDYREIEKDWQAYISFVHSEIRPGKLEAQEAIEAILIQLKDKLIKVFPDKS